MSPTVHQSLVLLLQAKIHRLRPGVYVCVLVCSKGCYIEWHTPCCEEAGDDDRKGKEVNSLLALPHWNTRSFPKTQVRLQPTEFTHYYHMSLLSPQRPVTHLAPTPNCTKWMLAPAGDVTYARKTTKGVFVSTPTPPHYRPTHWGAGSLLCFSCMFTHTQKINKHTRTKTCSHMYRLKSCGIAGAPHWKEAIISQLTERIAVWPDLKKVCVCVCLCGLWLESWLCLTRQNR